MATGTSKPTPKEVKAWPAGLLHTTCRLVPRVYFTAGRGKCVCVRRCEGGTGGVDWRDRGRGRWGRGGRAEGQHAMQWGNNLVEGDKQSHLLV